MTSLPTNPQQPPQFALARALRQPHLALLWFSQLLSAIGDHLYEIGIVWLSVQTVGSGAGWVLSAGATARLIFGLFGGVYADRWDRRRTMIAVDLIRAVAVLTLPLAALWGNLTVPHLALVAAVLGAVGALFDPALQASLPGLTREVQTLQAMNGLLDITPRMARIIGPALAGLLIAMMPLSHLFTLDGMTFLISAIALFRLAQAFQGIEREASPSVRPSLWAELAGAIRLVRANASLWWSLWGLAAINFLWSIAFSVGVALFANIMFNGDARAYGLLVGAYGVGNVISNLVVSHMPIHRPALWFFLGKTVLGVGFLVLAVAQNLPLALLGSAIAAIGGPMGDIPLLTTIQQAFPSNQIGKIYSLRMTVSGAGASLGLVAAAPLFVVVAPGVGIGACAVLMIGMGLVGIARFARGES